MDKTTPSTQDVEIDRRYLITRAGAKPDEKNGFQSEYLLLNHKTGERLHNDGINNTLRRINRMLDTPQKGNHSIRRTYISTLDANGYLSDEEIREAVGHKHISTTRDNYMYSRKSTSEKVLAFEKALAGKSVTPSNPSVTPVPSNAKAPEPA